LIRLVETIEEYSFASDQPDSFAFNTSAILRAILPLATLALLDVYKTHNIFQLNPV
jgi:hypothetical protein